MSVPFLDVRVTDPATRAQIDRVIGDLISTASYIGGKEVQTFAEEFGAYCGGGKCVTLANGTDALILALKALGIGAGDEVITVPFTFIATTEAITHVGATIRFVDIHPKTYTMDVEQLKRAITPKTKAILPVHLFGQPADMDSILEIANQHRLFVVEDAAQAHGAEYKGKRVGTLGNIACFSFYPTKNLGAMGDGGAVVSNNTELLAKVARLADHGRADRYYHTVEGFNSRLDTFQAAILRIKLATLDQSNERRRKIAEAYNNALRQQSFIKPPFVASTSKHVFHLYCVESSHRDALLQYLQDRQIGCGVYYPIPLHLQPAYARLGLKRGDFPVSETLSERILALPMYPDLSDHDLQTVCEALKAFSPAVLH
ncbi:MAG: dTDP-3-amino-3,4,6-trideoxy-alpha-D-glucose transaminase [Elusimicrobia bacterium]|nr:dTDP-3-amino-3,4,6-trideoxy-alpha-D-glucose transaminase [Elusimicrobiota bacterium]